jgi:hypothetical protein
LTPKIEDVVITALSGAIIALAPLKVELAVRSQLKIVTIRA